MVAVMDVNKLMFVLLVVLALAYAAGAAKRWFVIAMSP